MKFHRLLAQILVLMEHGGVEEDIEFNCFCWGNRKRCALACSFLPQGWDPGWGGFGASLSWFNSSQLLWKLVVIFLNQRSKKNFFLGLVEHSRVYLERRKSRLRLTFFFLFFCKRSSSRHICIWLCKIPIGFLLVEFGGLGRRYINAYVWNYASNCMVMLL